MVSYTPGLLTTYSGSPVNNFAVTNYPMSIGSSNGESAPGPAQPPTFTDVIFSDPSKNDRWIQWDHPNEQAAHSQCAPMSIANSLKYLHDTQDLELPFQHRPGWKGDDSLVGKIDTASGRPTTSRQSGQGISTGQAKINFLATHMPGKVETMIWGNMGADDGASNQTVTVGGNSATLVGKGRSIKMDEILQQLKEGANCEVVYSYAGGGAHAVDLVGAGFHNGAPWMLAISDMVQADKPNGDSRGAGPEGMEFMYLGKQDANGKYTSGSQTIQKVICEKPVPQPVTETLIFVEDPSGHSCCVPPPPSQVRVSRVGTSLTVTGTSPYLPLAGSIAADGTFSLSGTSAVAGFQNVTTTFIGSIKDGQYVGTISVGTGGQLPGGQPIRFGVSIPRILTAAKPTIRVNGFREHLESAGATLLRPVINVRAGASAGQSGDWWLLAVTPQGVRYFDLGTLSWAPGIRATYSGPLFDIPYFGLPYLDGTPGKYDFYFGFDSIPDGQISFGALTFDRVQVTVN